MLELRDEADLDGQPVLADGGQQRPEFSEGARLECGQVGSTNASSTVGP